MGKEFKPFNLLKFRSMNTHKEAGEGQFDPGDMERVTRVGFWLRKTKIDEIPELFNVLVGHMSIVGPRPEVEKYVNFYSEDFKEILKIRPGLSDYASIKYRDEEEILERQPEPDTYYRDVILPDKLRLAKAYVEDVSIRTDFRIILETIRSILNTK